MNIFITIITLIILIFLINYLTNGLIKNIVNKYFFNKQIFNILDNNLKQNLEFNTIIHDNNNNNNNNNDNNYNNDNTIIDKKILILSNNDISLNDDINNIYTFLDNLVNPNINIYQLIKFNKERLYIDNNFKNIIVNYINKICNSSYFIFHNVELLDDLYYYNNLKGKYIEIFKFTSHITNKIKQVYIGKLVFVIELFINEIDKIITILNFKLLGQIKDKNENDNNIYKFDDFFVKSEKQINIENNDNSEIFLNIDEIDLTLSDVYVPSIINVTETDDIYSNNSS